MTLRGQYIVLLGTTRFDGPDQSTSYSIAKELAKHNHVYYVDYPVTWKDLVTARNTDQIKRRKPFFRRSSDGLIETGQENLKIIITPPTLSINFLPEGKIYRHFLRINEGIIRSRIKKVFEQSGITDFIFINSFNFHYPGVATGLKPDLTVYHCVDPMIIPYDMKHGIISEEQLVKNSDLVICTSRQLYDEKIRQNPNTHFIPNAADLHQSSRALSDQVVVHPIIRKLKGPIIGYAGSIERRLDFDLLRQVFEQNPDKTFVFAGPVSKEFVPDWFYEMPNVVLPGRLPYQDMPALMKGFDVAIIPFKKDEVSGTIFPLKLFEYLGAGKPVVATTFNPDLSNFTGHSVRYSADAKSFSDAIELEYQVKDDPDSVKKRLAVAAANTWEKRGAELADLLQDNLKHKS